MPPRDYDVVDHLKKTRSAQALYRIYRDLSRVFNEEIHPQVTILANAQSNSFLTDHGPKHIAELISQASKLIRQAREKISVHEAFLLLVAIHLHDIGNALGREEHEQKAGDIWTKVYGPLGFDEWDMLLAKEIARVHGGIVDGSKDTISSIQERVTWRGEPIRKQYLAAILKLADEMAETRERANRLGIVIDAIPKANQIYHIYPSGVESILCDSAACAIRMEYKYRQSLFMRKFGKGDKEVYLLDEIYNRTLKTYSEALYCSRYFRGSIRIDRVSVKIMIYDESLRSCVRTIGYTLEPQGYEEWAPSAIFDRAPELANFEGGGKLTPERLSSLLPPVPR